MVLRVDIEVKESPAIAVFAKDCLVCHHIVVLWPKAVRHKITATDGGALQEVVQLLTFLILGGVNRPRLISHSIGFFVKIHAGWRRCW
jgi:hypothetical protein